MIGGIIIKFLGDLKNDCMKFVVKLIILMDY